MKRTTILAMVAIVVAVGAILIPIHQVNALPTPSVPQTAIDHACGNANSQSSIPFYSYQCPH